MSTSITTDNALLNLHLSNYGIDPDVIDAMENTRPIIEADELEAEFNVEPNQLERGRDSRQFMQSTASSLDTSTDIGLETWREIERRTSRRNVLSIVILTFINLLNYMDRYSVAGVLEQVQVYYDINFTDSGLIQTSFVVSYMLLSPVFGYLGDRYQRKYIMAAGIFFWSLFTLASSLIPHNMFGLFLFMRALVGVGEASYSTIAPTIIADLFAGKERTKALTLFYFAIPVGSGLGYIIGSEMAAATGHWQ